MSVEVERRRVLIVIDEAHNVCPAVPGDPPTALATDHAVRIAASRDEQGSGHCSRRNDLHRQQGALCHSL